MRYLKLLLAALTAALLGFSAFAAFSASAAKATPAIGTLQVCKVSTGLTPGGTYPFQEATWSGNYYSAYSLTAGGACQSHTFTVGTTVLVEEAASPFVPFSPLTIATSFSYSGGPLAANVANLKLVALTVVAGTSTLTVTNTPVAQPGTGQIELCKAGSDPNVVAPFTFTVSPVPAGDPSTVVVNATGLGMGPCSTVTVEAGPGIVTTITETPQFPWTLTSVTSPGLVPGSVDLNTSTAEVDVQPNADVPVTFTNNTLTGYVKVCKTLDRSQDNVLAGHTFNYSVTASFNGQGSPVATDAAGDFFAVPSSVNVTAVAFPTQTCQYLVTNKGVPVLLPLSTLVTVTETGIDGSNGLPPTVQLVGTGVSPANLNAGSTGPTSVSLYVGNTPPTAGVPTLPAIGSTTQADFTNEAFGYIEVCKTSTQGTINKGVPFTFTVAGAAIAPVEVGFCSPGILLPVGTTTVTETNVPAHVTATVTSGGGTQTGNSVVVNVPYNDDNIVTFDNEVNTSSLKICKAQSSSDAVLQATTFNLTYSWAYGATAATATPTTPVTVGLQPGQCTLPINGIPVLNKDLSPVHITVTEQTTPVLDVQLNGVGVTGLDSIFSQPTFPHNITASQGGTAAPVVLVNNDGLSTITFTNGRNAT